MSMPPIVESSNPLPPTVIGYVSVRGEASFLRRRRHRPIPSPSTAASRDQAATAIEQAGLIVIAESRLGIAVAGPAAALRGAHRRHRAARSSG